MNKRIATAAMAVIISAAGLAAGSASAATVLTYKLGALTINSVTDDASLSELTSLVNAYTAAVAATPYVPAVPAKPAVYKNGKLISPAVPGKPAIPAKPAVPASEVLDYAFQNGGVTTTGMKSVTPAANAPDLTIINYTFNIATPMDLLYGQVVNTVQGIKVALGGNPTIQLLDLTANKNLTPLVTFGSFGQPPHSASTANYDVNVFKTADLYDLQVIGTVPVGSAHGPLVEYSASVFATAVPEPATWAMMLIGFGGLGAVLRRRGKAVLAAA